MLDWVGFGLVSCGNVWLCWIWFGLVWLDLVLLGYGLQDTLIAKLHNFLKKSLTAFGSYIEMHLNTN